MAPETNKAFKVPSPKEKSPSPIGENEDKQKLKKVSKRQFQFSFWYLVLAMIILTILQNWIASSPIQTIEYSDFKQKIESGVIQRVELGQSLYTGFTTTRQQLMEQQGGTSSVLEDPSRVTVFRTVPVEDSSLVPLMDEKGVEYYTKPVSFLARVGTFALSWIVPIVILVLVWRFMFNRMGGGLGGVMSFGRNQAKIVAEGNTGVTFQDVAGADESKEELKEVVDFLKTPEKYEAIGGKIPKGVLLVGPPGTGKTLLAKAVAGEAKVPFFKISGADFVEMFVGVGAARVRDMFKQARENSPCIIFIDELDAIGKSRANSAMGNDEREQTLNQLLVEMDGFDTHGGVIILAATNRPEVLDQALLRPGRFDRQIVVDQPDLDGREAILKVHAQNVKLEESVSLKKVAQSTAGFSGADLANLINEAAILAVRANRQQVKQKDFDAAFEKIVAGLEKKTRVMNAKEKEIVAYHESGHALIAALTPGAEPVQKISIVPRGIAALGYTMQLPTEDRYLINKEELLGKIDVLLGGRAAEQVIFKRVTSGAANDLARATEIARKMIVEYGMSDKFENVALSAHQPLFLSDGKFQTREFSEETQRYIDESIAEIMKQRYKHVLEVIQNNKGLLESIAYELLEVEALDAEQFRTLMMKSA